MSHIAAIHTIKSQLAKQGVMTDEDYRALLLQLTGKTSSKDLSPLALAKVRDHFDRLAKAHGLSHVVTRKRPMSADEFAKRKAQTPPIERKAWALWGQLKRDGKIADGSAAAFRSFVKHQTKTTTSDGVDDIRFCTGAQTHQLVERMKQWLKRGSHHEKTT